MIAVLAESIDWWALQAAAILPVIRKCAQGDSKLMEAVEFLNGGNKRGRESFSLGNDSRPLLFPGFFL
jgi:hypothetical protein